MLERSFFTSDCCYIFVSWILLRPMRTTYNKLPLTPLKVNNPKEFTLLLSKWLQEGDFTNNRWCTFFETLPTFCKQTKNSSSFCKQKQFYLQKEEHIFFQCKNTVHLLQAKIFLLAKGGMYFFFQCKNTVHH